MQLRSVQLCTRIVLVKHVLLRGHGLLLLGFRYLVAPQKIERILPEPQSPL